jgi:PAS domain S-box-containing protein
MGTFSADELVRQTLLLEATCAAEIAVCVYDDDGRYVTVNDYACVTLGYSREELLQHDVGDFTEGGIDRRRLLSSTRREGVRRVQREDGSAFPAAFVVVPTTVSNLPYFIAIWWMLDPNDPRAADAT